MCLILACKEKKPTLEILQKAEKDNGDGAGIAWINADKKAQWIKGLDAQEIFNLSEGMELPFIIHFRRSSYGLKKDLLLTHPFIISEDSLLSLTGIADKILFHNGTMIEMDWKLCLGGAGLDVPNDGLVSDSRIIAMILSQHKNLNFLKKIKGNFVVLDSTKENKNYIIVGDTFRLYDGIYYSNMDWKNGNIQSRSYMDRCDHYGYGSDYDPNPSKTSQTTLPLHNNHNANDELALTKILYTAIRCTVCKELLMNTYIRKIFIAGQKDSNNMRCEVCSRIGFNGKVAASFTAKEQVSEQQIQM